MFKRIVCFFAEHRFDIADMTDRDSEGNVSCVCLKCGTILKADHGLGLDGIFVSNRNWQRRNDK